MSQFPTIDPLKYQQRKRPNQRVIIPTAIKNRSFSGITIENSNIVNSPGSIPTTPIIALNAGDKATLGLLLTPSSNKIVATLPFMCVWLEVSSITAPIPTADVIPIQTPINRYRLYGPFSEPQYVTDTTTGSTPTTLRFLTGIYNNDASQHLVMGIFQARYILGGAGTTAPESE